MQELTFEQVEEVSGAGLNEAACVAGFTYLGGLGGFIVGGAAGPIGMGQGFFWGIGLGSQLGSAVCLP